MKKVAGSKNHSVAIARIWEVVEMANKKFGTNINKSNLTIDLGMKGNSAGQASIKCVNGRSAKLKDHDELALRLRLNAVAIQEHLEDTLNDTIPHEVAHLVNFYDHYVPGRKHSGNAHDAGWTRIAMALGCTGERTHTLELRTNVFDYTLNDGSQVKIGPKHHKKIQNGATGFRIKAQFAKSGIAQNVDKTHYDGYVPPVSFVNPAPAKRYNIVHGPAQKMTKLEKAIWIFNTYKDLTRKEIIHQMVIKAELTPAGAATYYAKIKKAKLDIKQAA
jgi:predicted SprT family Zn-dependent metalloprotease